MSYETLIVALFHAVLAPATAVHALLFKRESRAAFGWIAVCVLFPLAGPVVYVLFGLNRTRERARRLELPGLIPGYERGDRIPAGESIGDEILLPYRELARIGKALSHHPLIEGNRVEPLHNGEAAYPAMLEAIEAARTQVLLTTYILDNDATGERFTRALEAAIGRGVDVRVLIDGFGEWYSFPRASRRLRRSGVRVAKFLPPRIIPPSLSINMRNHHKILVIDNRVGFTGGMNIGDRHCVALPDNRNPTRDIHFRLEGPVVDQLAQEFGRTWNFVTGETIELPEAPQKQAGGLMCRTLTDGPNEDLDCLPMLLTSAISAARKSVHIMTPYFLPPREIIGALQAATLRGLDVRLVMPEKNNLPFVHWATRNMLWELLFHDARVFYQPPPFNHAKLFSIDGYYSLIGSSNWDPRSLRLNFELQVEVYGKHFAEAVTDYIDAAAADGREVTLEEVDGRSLPVRLRDSACWLFSPYL